MGLGVTAYEHVHLIPDHASYGWCEDHSAHFIASPENDYGDEPGGQSFVYVGHELTAGGLQLLDYTHDDCHFGRCYTATGKTANGSWSYSGYGAFRKDLCLAANNVPIERVWNEPGEWKFALLLHFADNEGWIGPNAAAVLSQEFDKYADDVLPKLENEWHVKSYGKWRDLASATGAVVFH